MPTTPPKAPPHGPAPPASAQLPLGAAVAGPTQEPKGPSVTLEGRVERLVYRDPETGWSVIQLDEVDGHRWLRARGVCLAGTLPGELLRLQGQWVTDPRWGLQLDVHSALPLKPSTLDGLRGYLGSGLVPGIGAVMAERLVERFGLQTLEIIEQQPERLREVQGIGPRRADTVREAWQARRGAHELMISLQAHGLSPTLAGRIHQRFGAQALGVLREDPYRLADEVRGVGFRTADAIAMKMGMAPDSPLRARAVLMHVLRELAGAGHVFAPRLELLQHAGELVPDGAARLEEALTFLLRRGRLQVAPAGLLTHVAPDEEPIYLPSLATAEADIAAGLARLLSAPGPGLSVDVPRALQWLRERTGHQLGPEQEEALACAMRHKVLVVTGGPGTGKTTVVDSILRVLQAKGCRVLLGAPTGRAAKRLEEATGRPAATLHRLLEFSPKQGGFQRTAERPLEADVVVVDECSMLDTPLAAHLLAALGDACRLLLVGDVDQLPSVGPGNVLGDIIGSGRVPVAGLKTIYRQAQASRIVVNAHRIRAGSMPLLDEGADTDVQGRPASDFFFVEHDDPERLLELLVHIVTERIPARFGMDPVADVQVLAPMHRGLLGAANLNLRLQALLSPPGPEVVRGAERLRQGDKVMQLRNNYDLDVFNGDLGRIVGVDCERRCLQVDFDGRRVPYEATDLDQLGLAYACSVHKSQGSEYPAVVLPLHTQHYTMLQRNLLYTAVTRGKRLVVVLGSRRALQLAVSREPRRARHTLLAQRIRATCPHEGADSVGRGGAQQWSR